MIVDKGFASAANIEALEEEGLKFIMPPRRDSARMDYDTLKTGDKRAMDGSFKHENRFMSNR